MWHSACRCADLGSLWANLQVPQTDTGRAAKGMCAWEQRVVLPFQLRVGVTTTALKPPGRVMTTQTCRTRGK